MSNRFAVVEDPLRRAAWRWKCLRFAERSANLGMAAVGFFTLLGLAVQLEYLKSEPAAMAWLACAGLVVLGGWVCIGWRLLALPLDRSWLAAEIENSNPQLQDRINTLLHLQESRGAMGKDSFFIRIVRQAQGVVSSEPASLPFSSRNAWLRGGAFGVALALSLVFFHRYEPWSKLLPPEAAIASQPSPPPAPILPTNTVTEVEEPWGEVRITNPGRDLVIAKTNTVALHIEAAANSRIANVVWRTALNGGDEQTHVLPPPAESRFAAYAPELNPAALRLKDFDILSYHAEARTERGEVFQSEVYFLEVQPPPQEASAGKASAEESLHQEFLDELSSLVQQQQQVIKQTYRHAAKPHADAVLESEDRTKLSAAERELAAATQHLRGRMRATLADRDIKDLLELMEEGKSSLEKAQSLLQTNSLPQAQQAERSALASLSDTRKYFQRFLKSSRNSPDQKPEDAPSDPHAASRLSQMAEYRDASKVASDFLSRAQATQDSIALRAQTSTGRTTYLGLAAEERALHRDLEELLRQNPEVFKNASEQSAAVGEALQKSTEALTKRQLNEARNATQSASQRLKELAQTLRKQSGEQQLADAHKLKEMLDQSIRRLGQCQNPGTGSGGGSRGSPNDAQVQQTVADSKAVVDQLQKLSGESPTREQFGDALRESIGRDKKAALEAQLDQVAQSQGAQRQRTAGEAKTGLEKISDAFEQSLPSPLRLAMQQGRARPSGQEQIGSEPSAEEGMERLRELGLRLSQSASKSDPQDKDLREVLEQLRFVLSSKGSGAHSSSLAVAVEKVLKDTEPATPQRVQQLLDELKKFSVEQTVKGTRSNDPPMVLNLDPAKLPPAYRGRIEKYFQKLSEERARTAPGK